MNSEQHRVTAIRHWWLKAEESLRSAERELLADSLSFAINRIYYSVFYAVSAAMLERQIVSKKHTGVRAAFHREFIKTNVLDSQWGRFYDQLFEDRQEGATSYSLILTVSMFKNVWHAAVSFIPFYIP